MDDTFRFQQIINTYDSLPNGRVSPPSILNYFQEAAQRHVEELGIGLDYMAANHYAWILVKYEIQFHEYPKTEETVTIETRPVGINRFEAYREFRLLSAAGRVLVSACSVWMIINTETKKLVRIANVPEMRKLTEDDEVYRIPALVRVDDFDNERAFAVRYLDIDINMHVNNVKYLIWGLESLPWETIREYEIEKLTMIFKEQAFYGETVIVSSTEIGERTWRIDINNEDGKLLCQIELIGRTREARFD